MSDEFYFHEVPALTFPFIQCSFDQLNKLSKNARDILALLEHAKKGATAVNLFQTRLYNRKVVRIAAPSVKVTAGARYDASGRRSSGGDEMDLSGVSINFFVDLITYLPVPDIRTLCHNVEALRTAAQLFKEQEQEGDLNPRWGIYYTCLMTVDKEWAKLFFDDVQQYLAGAVGGQNRYAESGRPSSPNRGQGRNTSQEFVQSSSAAAPFSAAPNESNTITLGASEQAMTSPPSHNQRQLPPNALVVGGGGGGGDDESGPAPDERQTPHLSSPHRGTHSSLLDHDQQGETVVAAAAVAAAAQEETMHIRAIQAKQRAWGPDHPTTLDTVHDLGTIYSRQGKITQAEEMYVRALRGYEKAVGREHPRTRQIERDLEALRAAAR